MTDMQPARVPLFGTEFSNRERIYRIGHAKPLGAAAPAVWRSIDSTERLIELRQGTNLFVDMTTSRRLAGPALIAALTLTIHAARAADDEAHRIANNFSHENLICGAYHSLVSQCLANRDPKDELVDKYRQTALTFIERAVKAGRGIGLSEKVISAKVEVPKQEMMSEIDGLCTNISLLLEKHAQRCKRLYEDGPKSHADEMSRAKKAAMPTRRKQ